MTLEFVRAEMTAIRTLKRTDIDEARERWKSLRDRMEAYLTNNKLPEIWKEVYRKELTGIKSN